MVESIADHATEIQSVWPGFIASFSHAIYTKRGDIYLLSSQPKLNGWELKAKTGDLFIWYKKSVDLKQFERSFFIQESFSPDIVVDGAQDQKNPIKMLFHESFHGFQNIAMADKKTDWSEVAINQHMLKIKQAEFNLLQQILETKQADELPPKIRLYVSLRVYREALMEEATVSLERNMEWQEGVATFVGFRIGEIIDRNDMKADLTAYGQRLKREGQHQKVEKFLRFDAYFHGATISYLLNQFDPEWQSKISQGQTPFELLTAVFTPETLSQADVENGLNLKSSNHSFETSNFDALANWNKALFFDLKYTDKFNFVGKKIESKPNGTLVHDASKVHTESAYLKLSARATLMFLSENRAVFKLSSSPNEIKKCEKITPQEYLCDAGTLVKFKGIKLKLKQAMTLRKTKQQWHLTESADN